MTNERFGNFSCVMESGKTKRTYGLTNDKININLHMFISEPIYIMCPQVKHVRYDTFNHLVCSIEPGQYIHAILG